MERITDLSLFTKVEVDSKPRAKGDFITVPKDKRRLNLTSALANKAGLEPDTRVDLYRMGHTFALKKTKAGCLKVTKTQRGATTIHSAAALLEITAHTDGARKFEAWVEGDVVFFKPVKE